MIKEKFRRVTGFGWLGVFCVAIIGLGVGVLWEFVGGILHILSGTRLGLKAPAGEPEPA